MRKPSKNLRTYVTDVLAGAYLSTLSIMARSSLMRQFLYMFNLFCSTEMLNSATELLRMKSTVTKLMNKCQKITEKMEGV
jgi:hypothetical protein